MFALASTRITILRGETTNDYGDEVDTTEPYKRDIPASFRERSRRVFDPSSGTPRTLTFYECQVNSDVDVVLTDRIKDQNTNQIYAIDDIANPPNPFFKADTELFLSKVN